MVDDEEFVRKLIRIKLGFLGLRVIEAANGEEAVRLAREESPDLILLDVMMPRMNGFEACEKIKQDPKTAQVPIIMLTARGEQTAKERGAGSGALRYFTKPFSPQKLAELVMEVLHLGKGR